MLRSTVAFAGLGLALAMSGCGKSEPATADVGAPRSPETPAPTAPADAASATPSVRSPADDWTSDKRARVIVRAVDPLPGPERRVAIELDVLDPDSGLPVDALDAGAMALSIDGQYVPGRYEVATFRDAGRSLGLALVLPAHKDYVAGPDPDQGLDISPLAEVKKGAEALLRRLRPNDRVTVFGLTEEGVKLLAPWGPPDASVVAGLTPLTEAHPVPPGLYRALSKALVAISEDSANLPARRVVLTVSDGLDPLAEKQEQLTRRIAEAAGLARTPEVHAEIWALGFTLAMPEPLVALEELVTKTGGRFRRVDFAGHKELGKRFEELGAEVERGFVVTFTPDADAAIPSSAKSVELALRLPSGAVGRAQVYSENPVP